MSAGYVYVLVNESMPGLVKIGGTRKSTQERAKKLSDKTAVPTPFEIAHEVHVSDWRAAEQVVFARLAYCRASSKREFFKLAVLEAIEVVSDVARMYQFVDLRTEVAAIAPQYELPRTTSAWSDMVDKPLLPPRGFAGTHHFHAVCPWCCRWKMIPNAVADMDVFCSRCGNSWRWPEEEVMMRPTTPTLVNSSGNALPGLGVEYTHFRALCPFCDQTELMPYEVAGSVVTCRLCGNSWRCRTPERPPPPARSILGSIGSTIGGAIRIVIVLVCCIFVAGLIVACVSFRSVR
jgi:hypothetical protein